MRRAVPAIVAAIVILVGTAGFAQSYASTVDHNVQVVIPTVAFLRILNPGTSLDFQPSANTIAADAASGTTYTMSGTSGQDRIQALVNKGNWSLGVAVSTTGTTDAWAGSSTNGLALSQITVTPGAAGTGVPSLSSFSLADAVASASGVTPMTPAGTATSYNALSLGTAGAKTNGWQDVGIDAGSYTLTLTGNESPGTYTATVTYILATP